SAVSARCARGGLQAPRMRYGRISLPSFFFIVAATSISVSTPKPSLCNSCTTRSSAVSNFRSNTFPKPYLVSMASPVSLAEAGSVLGRLADVRAFDGLLEQLLEHVEALLHHLVHAHHPLAHHPITHHSATHHSSAALAFLFGLFLFSSHH